MLVITHEEHQDLFWSNGTGWGSLSGATVFHEKEKDTLNLPIRGEWVVLPEFAHSREQHKMLEYIYSISVVAAITDGRLLIQDNKDPYKPLYWLYVDGTLELMGHKE